MNVSSRAATHAAMGDVRRLMILDHLAAGDRTVAELAEMVGLPGNLLAHHLDVLAEAGLIRRRVSEGDHRRRYVSLQWDALPSGPPPRPPAESIAFICTHNSARSQFAAGLWTSTTGDAATSAGSDPAHEVHPTAVLVASEFGVDLSGARPAGYEQLDTNTSVLISVCDRARESDLPPASEYIHWSVPDPVAVGTRTAFRSAFREIALRIDHLTGRPSP